MVKAGRAMASWRVYREVTREGSPSLMSRVKAVPKMIAGTLRGDYRELGKGKLALMGMGLLYIVSPIDAIPEFLPLIGVTDDFGVLLWLTASVLGESGRYVDWERRRIQGEIL
ncbi:YkvA family protein [Sphaerisporangium sp. TRM90804]|uniref:YkvA family protein n=1 Tax=Sphaerisporangium sp. TRM90804 TaxID=3031113 RepID=UPI00244685D0|nr:YkvA family protein [Sphaerisporangium sp. TRM90804]MDH2425492.1 YkvA family protein [Sphaerisporangium sp. TRM90804]